MPSVLSVIGEKKKKGNGAGNEQGRCSALPGTVVIGPNDAIMHAGRSFCRLTGYAGSELPGRSLDKILYPTVPDFADSEDAVTAEASPSLDVGCLLKKNGRTVWVQVKRIIRRDGSGRILHRIYRLRELLDRTMIESVENEGEQLFRNAFENAALGMIIFDNLGGFLRVNPFLCRLLGYTEDELKGKHFIDITHPEDVAMSVEWDRRILARETRTSVYEKRYLHKDGTPVWVLISNSLMYDRNGHPRYFVAHVQDIRELRTQRENLERVNTALKVMMDHRETEMKKKEKDILTHLERLILPYLRMVGSRLLDPEQASCLGIALSNMSDITDTFASRLTSSEALLSPTELQIADMLRHGRTSDEIADAIGISPFTVARHRASIRKKLGLTNKKINLCSYLQSLSFAVKPHSEQ
jgi:PAS domain S-box-containing protein